MLRDEKCSNLREASPLPSANLREASPLPPPLPPLYPLLYPGTDKTRRHAQSDELTDSGILNRVIPFSTRHVNWHTDATYYGSNHTIQGLFLLCKRPALEGGSNKILDHEMLYIRLRDKNPDALNVLMSKDCLNYRNPTTGEVDPHRGGKVFWMNTDGHLCHRFSFRKTDLAWSEDSDVSAARDMLESLIADEASHVIEGRLETGMGLISNNVLHTRERLVDSDDAEQKRLLFRTRFYAPRVRIVVAPI